MKTVSYVLLLWLNVLTVAHATEVEVRYDQGTYYFLAEFDIDASPAKVMALLTDYENIPRLNSAIQSSELLETSDGNTTRIRTVAHDCVLFFCRDITRVEDVHQDGDEKLEAYIIPLLSDLRSGYAVWVLAKNISGTTVKYNANVQPKFWIPPIIRSYVLTRKFKARVLESVERLQAIAKP